MSETTALAAARTETIAALLMLNALAKRDFPVVGTTLAPSAYDLKHVRLNCLLDELDLLNDAE